MDAELPPLAPSRQPGTNWDTDARKKKAPVVEHIPSAAPLQPLYVLRGHSAQINVVYFLRNNSRLLTGDADGWIVLWKISSRRAVAVWKAHEGAILGVADWGGDKIITWVNYSRIADSRIRCG